MQLLGDSLEELLVVCKRHFTLKTVLLLSEQMIKRIEFFHSKHYVHRDIKPQNFLIGTGKLANTIYLIDFGLSHRFRDPTSGVHIPYSSNKNFIGTARYSSANTHRGLEQSRRDDMQSLGYIFVYFLTGKLPWQNMPAETKKEKYENIAKKKLATTAVKLTRDLPREFCNFVSYSESLKFDQQPDYASLIKSFKDLFIQQAFTYDQMYDWVPLLHVKIFQLISH